MRRFFPMAVLAAILVPCLATAAPVRAVFSGTSQEHQWTLKELNPDLPSDWSGYDFLVLEMRHSSAHRYELRLVDGDAVRRIRMQPFEGALVRIAVPLKYFRRQDREGMDLAALGNKPRKAFWMGPQGPYGDLKSVSALGLWMEYPVGNPSIEIRSVQLAKTDPGDEVLEPKPLVDQFGQWIPAEWPGKAKTVADLQHDWAVEEKELGPGDYDYCQYGGYKSTKAKATGFFRVEQVDGRWWFVDPDGHLFFSTGADVMVDWNGTNVEGREDLYEALPPSGLLPSASRGQGGSNASFYSWNLLRRFGPEWNAKWVDFTLRRMTDWGLNTVANWSDARLWDAHRKAYVVILRGWGMETGVMGMPDVFSPEFPEQCDRAAAQQCAPRKDDPYLLGYFIANEPPWPGRESLLVDAILDGPTTATQAALKAFLQKGDTPARRKMFVYLAFEKFLAATCLAIRKNDPNHLNLGLRFGNKAPEEMLRASSVFDVFSMNSYSYAVNPQDVETANRLTGRPVMIGEFHFGALDRGLAPGLRQTRNQEERGVAYRYYVEQAASQPALIGTHWFEWVDEPATGRHDGENYNIGMVDVTDRPYREMVDAIKATNKRLYAVHAGKEPPVSRKAEIQ